MFFYVIYSNQGNQLTGMIQYMKENEHKPFPSWLSFILNNPIKRYFNSPNKVIEKLNVKKTDVVLDFGSGPGFYSIPFAKIANQVIAVDIQLKMLDKVGNYAKKKKVNVKCIQSDGQKIDLSDKSCDLIFLSFVYHELGKKENVILELLRLLKLNGKIVIQEKIKKGFFPTGPPIINLENILNELNNLDLSVIETIKNGNDILIVAINKKSA